MPSYNKTNLIGNLTRDPEVRYTPKGSAVCDISLAINRKWKDDGGQAKEEVTYVDCTAWGKTAELIGQYVKKGDPLFVEGRLATESWDDKASGQKRSKMKVVIEGMQFLGSKQGGEQQPARQQQRPAQRQQRPSEPDEWTSGAESDDIPF